MNDLLLAYGWYKRVLSLTAITIGNLPPVSLPLGTYESSIPYEIYSSTMNTIKYHKFLDKIW